MENKMKRLLAGILTASMLLSVSTAVFADEAETMPPEIPKGMGGKAGGEKPLDMPEGEITQKEYDEAIASIDAGEYILDRGDQGNKDETPEKAPKEQEVNE